MVDGLVERLTALQVMVWLVSEAPDLVVVQEALDVGALLQVGATEEGALDALQDDCLELGGRERKVLCVSG